MRQGFVKVAAMTPKAEVADPKENAKKICEALDEAYARNAKIVVFPELCITGYSCGDLFWQELLLRESMRQLLVIAEYTNKSDALVFVGLPIMYQGKLYNTAAVLQKGKVLGFVPKVHIPNYNECYEARYFTRGMKESVEVTLENGDVVPMGTKLLFSCATLPELVVAAEICEDVWAANPPSIEHALAGATLIVNLAADNETTGKDVYRRDLIKGQSARLLCGYVYSSAGEGESTQDAVFSGHNIIAENGTLLMESIRFTNEAVYSEVDVERLAAERRRMSTFVSEEQGYRRIFFTLYMEDTALTRYIESAPFVPSDRTVRDKHCEEILMMQAAGLKKRLSHTNCRSAVVGVSGGLDSTLALLVTVKAFDLLNIPRKNILAVTMPGFGTTDRTYDNALSMIRSFGVTLREVDIKESVRVHFADIGHDENVHDVTYENAQARERTQILMDIANKNNGMVIGTGDMSELALGWATYNGDHMSMYGVNASVPKTLVRYLVAYYAQNCEDENLSNVLIDVLDTPVSPELLPPSDGKISQKTEDLVGPYELHDFYLYYVMRFGFTPKKIYRLATLAFADRYDNATILKWLKKFYWRFFSQQFKRSCLPDGPKVGTVALSPRGDLRMPSDASVGIWMNELEML